MIKRGAQAEPQGSNLRKFGELVPTTSDDNVDVLIVGTKKLKEQTFKATLALIVPRRNQRTGKVVGVASIRLKSLKTTQRPYSGTDCDSCPERCSQRSYGEGPFMNLKAEIQELTGTRRYKVITNNNEIKQLQEIVPGISNASSVIPTFLKSFVPKDFCCSYDQMRRLSETIFDSKPKSHLLRLETKPEKRAGTNLMLGKDIEAFYPILSGRKGLVFFFCFTKDRPEAEMEMRKVEKTFKIRLQCEYHLFKDPSKADIEDILQGINSHFRSSVTPFAYNYVTVILAAHGGLNDDNIEFFVAKNDERGLTDTIRNFFRSNEYFGPTFRDRAKLLIYGPCRGRSANYAMRKRFTTNGKENKENEDPSDEHDGVYPDGASSKRRFDKGAAPMSSDHITIYASELGDVAWRDAAGSVLISELCREINEGADKRPVDEMIRRINGKMKKTPCFPHKHHDPVFFQFLCQTVTEKQFMFLPLSDH